jgi:tetratricopeptide (TPR) repeat protein
MMDYRKILNEMKVPELRETAGRLKIASRANLKMKHELIEAILNCLEKEIKKALGLGWWNKYKKPLSYFGAIASITALFLGIWAIYSSQKETASIKTKLGALENRVEEKIDDPATVARIKEEYEKKLADMEETLKNLKTVDKKARDEALKAFREGDYSKARKLFEEIRKKEKEKQKEYAQTAYNLGEIAFLELDFKGALAHYLEAESLDPDNTLYQNEAGKVYYTFGQYEKAKEYYEKTLSSDMKTYGSEHPKVATRWNNLGLAWNSLGKYEKAKEYFEKALSSDLKTYGSEHPKVATRWNNLGLAWSSLGKYEKAIEYYEKANSINIKHLGEEHPRVAATWNNLGSAWYSLGKYEKAIEYYEKALSSDLKTYGSEHPKVAFKWNNLGLAWKALGKYEKAIEYYEKALSSDLKTYGSEHPKVAIYWNNLGSAWESLGKYQKAIEYLKKSLQSNLNNYGNEHISIAYNLKNFGKVYISLKKYEKAIEYLDKAVNIFLATVGEDHPKTKKVKNNLEITRKKLK